MLKVVLFTLCLASLMGQDIVLGLVRKLMRVCGEDQSVDLFACLPTIIQNDKANGNYRPTHNYTR
jgi:hypothetical protein